MGVEKVTAGRLKCAESKGVVWCFDEINMGSRYPLGLPCDSCIFWRFIAFFICIHFARFV